MSALDALQIIKLLETPTKDRRPIKDAVLQEASISELISALEISTVALTRHILCDILGERHDKSAIPVLVLALDEDLPHIRSAAADALGKIGDKSAGEALMKRFHLEQDVGVRQMLAAALGAVDCKNAIPLLIEALKETDAMLRSCAAWSLGELGATDAVQTLQQTLSAETDLYTAERIKEALTAIAT